MKNFIACAIAIAFSMSACVESGNNASADEENQSEEVLDTFEENASEYGFGVKITDAYYLPESAAGTRLVVTVSLENTGEPADISFDVGAFRDSVYVTTTGAGNVGSEGFNQSSFSDEYEEDHNWCYGSVSVSENGSYDCSFLFFQMQMKFDSVGLLVTPIKINGLFQPIDITTSFDAEPRRL